MFGGSICCLTGSARGWFVVPALSAYRCLFVYVENNLGLIVGDVRVHAIDFNGFCEHVWAAALRGLVV